VTWAAKKLPKYRTSEERVAHQCDTNFSLQIFNFKSRGALRWRRIVRRSSTWRPPTRFLLHRRLWLRQTHAGATRTSSTSLVGDLRQRRRTAKRRRSLNAHDFP
jgi:hypothetical protein